jgi:Zn-dependent M16 (insulinase) family peptidase
MKGAYSDPDNLLYRKVKQSLFPDNVYGNDSGGDPTEIPNLTYAQFKAFHDTYYHPSNARIFFYGDDDVDERLRLVNEYLKDFEPLSHNGHIPLQPRFDQPRREAIPFAASDEDATQGQVTVNWVLNDITDTETTLALEILSHILIETPASPLRQALIESGLGEDLAGIGLEAELRQVYFSTGLKGVEMEDADAVEALVLDTLDALAEDGIDPDMIEAALNTIEFVLRENNTGSYPRGLLLMINALSTWLYGSDPLAPLAFEAPLNAVKQHVQDDPRFFEGLIRRYFLDNPHRTTVIMQPDPALAERQEAAERERLERIRAGMSADDLVRVAAETQALKRQQETPDSPEALAAIPSLGLDDLARENKLIPLVRTVSNGGEILYHDLFTNGIVYLDLGFNLHALPQEYLPYVTLFGRALLEMGTAAEDYVKLAQRIGRKTGGIDPTSFTSTVRESGRSTAWLVLRGKATTDHAGDLLDILRDVLLTARLDNRERFRQIVLEEKASREAGLVPGGHIVALTRLRAHFSESDWAAEQMGGVSYLFFLRQLAEEIEQNWPAVLERLEAIRQRLVNRRTMLANVTLDAANWSAFQPELTGFLADLPAAAPALEPWQPDLRPEHEGLTIPAQVNYVGKGANLYRLGYELDGSALVINGYLQTTWLWERVRVQGGAYGGFSAFDHRSGTFGFVSYRDPNLAATLETYDQTAQFLKRLDLNEDELVKSIIGTIGRLDAYQLPDAKGFTSMQRYLAGDTDASRQQLRDEVLSTTVEDFRQFGAALERLNEAGVVVVVGSAQAIEAANTARTQPLSVTRVL